MDVFVFTFQLMSSICVCTWKHFYVILLFYKKKRVFPYFMHFFFCLSSAHHAPPCMLLFWRLNKSIAGFILSVSDFTDSLSSDSTLLLQVLLLNNPGSQLKAGEWNRYDMMDQGLSWGNKVPLNARKCLFVSYFIMFSS